MVVVVVDVDGGSGRAPLWGPGGLRGRAVQEEGWCRCRLGYWLGVLLFSLPILSSYSLYWPPPQPPNPDNVFLGSIIATLNLRPVVTAARESAVVVVSSGCMVVVLLL